jgi:succinate dehydrogenase / fumarate reductase membrane anchor subunit
MTESKNTARDIINSKSTGEGSHEWLEERIYGLFSIPLLIWFMVNMAMVYKGFYLGLDDFLSIPFNAILTVLFVGFFLYYLSLSMKVVFEDYVSCKCMRFALILGLRFVGVFAFVATCLAVIKAVAG